MRRRIATPSITLALSAFFLLASSAALAQDPAPEQPAPTFVPIADVD
jgi:hypothetical protein